MYLNCQQKYSMINMGSSFHFCPKVNLILFTIDYQQNLNLTKKINAFDMSYRYSFQELKQKRQ